MKTLMCMIVMLVGASVVQAEEGTAERGLAGGKLLGTPPLQVEFFVTPERKVELRLVDETSKPVPVTSEVLTVIAQAPTGKVTLTLENTAGTLVSTEALPEGDGYTVVVQVRASAEAKPSNYRVVLNMHTCGECSHPEYACTCDHGAEEGHSDGDGHGH